MNKYVLKDFFVIPLHSVFFSTVQYVRPLNICDQLVSKHLLPESDIFLSKITSTAPEKKQCSKIVAGIRLLKDVLKWYIILQTRHLFLSTIRKYQGNAKFTKEISNLHCYLCNVHLTTYVLSEKCSGFKIGEIVLW